MSHSPCWGSVTCMNRTLRTPLTAAALAAVSLAPVACGNTARVDKAGTVSHPVTVVTLQTPDGSQPDALYFAQDVARRSGGTLKVVINPTTYASTVPANEAKLVAALRAGRVGFSYQPARDWAAAGLAGFQALDTPFLVTTEQTTEKLATSPVAGALLRQLTPLGLVGLGLIPNEPRQILSARPLIAPPDFDGTRLRIVDNPETAALVRAIDAHPVQGVPSTRVGGMLRAGSIVGVETSPMYILTNAYERYASYLTGYALFPKFQTIVATRTAWRKLTAPQRAAMRQAAADTLAYAGQTVTSLERHELAGLCAGGLVLEEPSSAQLAALAQRAASAAPAGAWAAAMIQMIKAAVPGTGPHAYAVPPPAQCRTASTAAHAIALHRLALRSQGAPVPDVVIPPGTYVTTDTVADWQAGGVADLPGLEGPITWTWHLYPNGTFYETQTEYPGSNSGFIRGRYYVKGDELTFNSPALDDNPETVRWSYYDGQLTFTIVNVTDAVAIIIYTAHPWRKVS
jgi:TRAP-type C4-dicarboxylate transport system substrate-binding protein